jgi:hypothetical protein
MKRGPLSLVSTNEELLEGRSRGSGLESREFSCRYPSRWPRGTLYQQKLALTSPTSGPSFDRYSSLADSGHRVLQPPSWRTSRCRLFILVFAATLRIWTPFLHRNPRLQVITWHRTLGNNWNWSDRNTWNRIYNRTSMNCLPVTFIYFLCIRTWYSLSVCL